MHVAVILPRWVGDAVMATPLLRAVRAHVGTAGRVTGVMRPVVADLLAGTGWIDDHVFYDRHGRNPAHDFRSAARNLRRDRADVALVLPNSLSSAALAWCGGARRRVGHAGHRRRWLLTDVVTTDRGAAIVPPPQAFLEVGEAAGMPRGTLDVELAIDAAQQAQADQVLASLFPGRNGPLIVLNDNSSNGTARAWGVEKHAALAARLADRVPGVRVLVHCGPADRDQARAIVAGAGATAVQSLAEVPDLPLSLSKGVYARADASVSSDSGPRHIAAGFRVPTVALVGPTDLRLGRSDPERCVEIRRELPCSPCDRRECPLHHHDCMRTIGVDEVADAVMTLLERRRGPA